MMQFYKENKLKFEERSLTLTEVGCFEPPLTAGVHTGHRWPDEVDNLLAQR